tara:strand:- start:619 stop:3018 length:2400 start_codon:yes stop_codon:yes gene_type:complete
MSGTNGIDAVGTMGSWTSHVDETKRGLAKLLAKENVTVVHAAVKTASFDLASRVLTLPKWQNITVDQYDLLIGHEVGHARYSDDLESLKGITRGLHTYINVLEDTRIERLMKEEFPGLRGAFRRGYEDFATKGPLFQLDRPVAEYSFIDRVNIHYKIGASVDVPFSAAERAILTRIDALRTMRDAVELAKELYTAEKEAKENEPKPKPERKPKAKPETKENAEPNGDDNDASEGDEGDGGEQGDESDEAEAGDEQGDGSESGDEEGTEGEGSESGDEDGDESDADASEGDEDGDDDDEAEAASKSNGTGAGDCGSEPESATDIANNDAMHSMASGNANSGDPLQVTYGTLSRERVAAQTVTNAQYTEAMLTFLASYPDLKAAAERGVVAFNTKHAKTIAAMAIEFDRRKTAKRMERAKTSRTGALDMSKLHAYKFREDIFQTVTTLPNGQSHGIALVLDGSGSMSGVIAETLEQVMIFASFAAKVRIPFRAYMFLDRRDGGTKPTVAPVADSQIYPSDEFQMVQLFDSTAKNWKAQMTAVSAMSLKFSGGWIDGIYQIPYADLGGTPLLSSMVLMDRFVAEMKASLRLEKMTLIVCTDGEDGSNVRIHPTAGNDTITYGRDEISLGRNPFICRDTVTRKSYRMFTHTDGYLTGVTNGVWNMLVDAFQTRYDCRVVAIKIASLRLSKRYGADRILDAAKQFMSTDAANARYKTLTYAESDVLVKSIEQSGTVALPAKMTNCDAAIILTSSSMGAENADDLFASKSATATTDKQIAKAFKSANIASRSSKVFINAVMPFIA